MSSLNDLVKRANGIKATTKYEDEDEKKGANGTNSAPSQTAEKSRSSLLDLVRRANSGTVKLGSRLTGEQVNSWYSGVDSIAKQGSAYVTADGYRKQNTVVPQSIEGYLKQADDVAVWLRANKDSIDNYDEVLNSHYDTVNYLRSLQSGVKSVGQYYSRWDSEDDYFKTAADTRTDRQKKHADNQARINELQEEQKSAGFIRKTEIDKEISALQAENNQYERGENGWVSKTMDDYYGHTSAEDFKSGSANRDFANPTRETLDYYDVMTDSTSWYTDANGNTYDAFGNKIDKTNVDKKNRIVHPMANDERFAVNDRLGMYLNATDDEVSEAVGMLDTDEGSWAKVLADGEYYHWDNLTSTEVDIYYYLLNTQGTKAADKFLDDMEIELAKRETMEYNQKWQEDYENADALGKFFMSAASVPVNVIGGGIGYLDDLGNIVKGEEVNPYNIAHSGMHYSNTVRGLRAQEYDDTGIKIPVLDVSLGEIYQVGMSRLDSAFAMYIGGVAANVLGGEAVLGTKLAKAISSGVGSTVLGMGAAQNEGYRLYQAGASEGQIATGAFFAGAAELVFEHIGLDALDKIDAKTLGQWVTKALIQGGIEAGEEGLTEISNLITNAIIMGPQSDLAKLYEDNGGDFLQTALGAAYQVYKAGVGGFLGGLGAGVTQGGKTYINTQAQYINTGKTITSAEGGVDALKALANEVAGVSSTNFTSDVATGKGIGKVFAGAKNLNNAQRVGKLFDTVKTSLDSQSHADIVKTLTRGDDAFTEEKANAIAGALIAQANGMELTPEQRRLLESVKDNPKVQRSLNAVINNDNSTVGQRNQKLTDFARDVAAGRIAKATGVSADVVKDAMDGKDTTLQENASEGHYEVSADGKTIDSKGNDIVITGVESVENGRMVLKTETGTIDSSEVQYASEADALIYEAIANIGASPASSWAMIKAFNEADGTPASMYATAAPLAYLYGKLGYEKGVFTDGKPRLGLTTKQSVAIYQIGRSDAEAVAKATAQASAESIVSEKNADKAVIFEGFTYSKRKANKVQKASMEAIELINKMSSLEIHVYQSYKKNGKLYAVVNGKERLAPNGYYTDGGKVYVDINAGNMGEGLMLYTLSHEIGHHIARYDAQDFKVISDFLFAHYGENVPVYDLLEAQKRKLKKSYEADGKPIPNDARLEREAQEELVCDMLSRMLADKYAYDKLMELKQQDLNAFQKLGQAIKKALDKLAKVLGIYGTQNPDFLYAASKENFGEEAFRQLQDLYIKAFVQADANYQAAEAKKNTTDDGGGVMYMSRDIDSVTEDTVRADLTDVFNGNNVASRSYIPLAKSTPFAVRYITEHMKDRPFIVDKKKAYFDMREDGKFKEDSSHHYHGMGVDGFLDALDILEDPEYAILEQKSDGKVHYAFISSNENGEEVCVVFQMEVTKSPEQMNGFPGGYYNLDITEFVATDEWLEEHGVEPGTSYVDYLLSFSENSLAYDRRFHMEQLEKARAKELEKARIIDSESAGVAASYDNNRASGDKVTQPGTIVKSESSEAMDIEVDEKTESVAPSVLMSERTWTESDYVQERETAAKEIAKAIGVSVKKAKAYIDSVNSIAKMIADDRVRLDYFSSPGRSSLVGNVEYGGSFDFSTLCKKRRLLTGTFTAIQKALPNTALTADEILDIRNRMKDAGLEVSCGLCYVEGSRANMGQFAKEFLRLYKQYYPDAWQPNMADVNTPDGIEWVRINHPEVYEQYEYFWNHYGTLKDGDKNLFASQQKPKLYQLHTEYKGEILEKFNDDDNVEEKNLNGGIRLQSFSDFEIVHLIDTMQIIMDMSRVGLAGQAYTKVPDFAWALGDTGLKINLSLIAKGVDENGKLIFDDVEGMPIDKAVELRNRYSKNVGTILVAFNDEQLMAAMADERVDYIIPFHRSQWKKSQYGAMGLPAKTKDYTFMQNEKFIKPQYHEYRGRMVKDKATNYMPNEYWDFAKSGKENAEGYLEMCARNNKRPKFYKLLQNNGDGSYSLKADGSTDGYWKLLIDFKMYDNEGNGSPQMPVKPDFNMDEATRMLNEYSGGHSNFPVAQGVVDDFVQEYKDSHKGVQYSDRDNVGYHAGDLGKAEFYHQQGYGRDTGHFGTGTYFVGEEEKITDGSYGERPRHAVDFSGYNLYKVKSDKDGYELHDQLRVIDGGFTQEFLDAAKREDFAVSNLNQEAWKLTDEYSEEQWDEELGMMFTWNFRDARMRAYVETAEKYGIEHMTYEEWLTSESEDVSSLDKFDLDYYKSDYADYIKAMFAKVDEDINRKYKKLRDAYFPLWLRFGKNQVDKALQVAVDYQKKMNPSGKRDYFALRDSKADSLATVFMKSLGYEGIDVRGTALDNTAYGSVIYDLHEDSILYQERADDSASNRSLLANAFEGVAQNEIERNKIQEYKEKISLVNAEEQKLSKLNEQIKELSFAKGPRDTKKIRDLQFEARQTANRISTYDKMLLRLEASKPLQDVLQREKKMAYKRAEQKGKEALEAYREKTMKTQRELLEKWQESRKKGIDSRQRTAMRHKIKDIVNELNQYLLKGTMDRHVPESLQKAVAEALDAVNMDTVGAEERIDKLKTELLKAKTPEQIQEISRKIDHIQEMGDKMNGRLKKLKDAYDELLKSPDENTRNSYDDVIHNKLDSVIDKIGNTPLRDMTLAQLEDVYDMYRMVLKAIRDVNKSFKDAKNQSISTRANAVMAQVEEVGGKHTESPTILNGIKKFFWNNLKPVYAFEHIGSVTLTEAFKNVRAGEDTWALDIVEARKYYLEKTKQYKYDSWDFQKQYTFESTSGMEFKLNLEQIMSLYAYSKRDQAEDHLKYGGIVFDESTKIIKKTKLGISLEFNPTDATAYNISEETLAEITSKLKDEQKDFVDEMQDYLSTVMGAKGNEVSMAMYDIKLFKDKNYFPLKSAQQFMEKARDQQKGEVKIKNSGFSKETVPKAKNPIVLTPFMDVWANHVNEMSMYHAFVLPLEDFYRIYNYKTPSNDANLATEGVNQYIQNAYGRGATAYIDQLLKDMNGGAITDSTTGFINKMMGLFKKGSVFASLSVTIQQPSAIARATALVDTKYFIGPKVDHKRHKELWDEVKQYAPVAIIKEMGYFDTNMGKSTQDYILSKEYSGFSEKMKALVTDSGYRDELLSKAPALADELAWCSIWEAVKRETKAKNPGMDAKSEAFLKIAGERFTEVIVKTQVYDSVLSRSGLMRSKDTGMKMATAFMAEPTTSINMIADALLQGKRGNRKYARAAIGAVIASQILNSILVSFVYAGRDDDEDETYLEKYIGTFTAEMLDGLNPATYIPFIKDIVSIVQGYDVERSDMAVVSDLWNAWQNLSKDNVSAYRKVEGFAGSIAQIFGLPVKNIMRDARGIYQTIESFVNGQQTTAAGIGYAVKGAITGKDVSDSQQLYEAYLSGDKDQIARVKGRFKDQNAINNAIRKGLRENDPRIHQAAIAWNANNLDEYMRIAKEIIAEKHFVQDDVVMAIRAEASSLAPDNGATSTSKAKALFTEVKFAEAVSQGNAAMANAIKTDIIQTAIKNGKTADEAEKNFNSSAKTALKEQFLAGNISENEAVSALTAYCGIEQDDAMADIQYWAFKQFYPDVYADDQWFDTYYEKIADSGLDIEVYMEYRNKVSTITGDGKKEKRMAVINSLPITRAQKDALYRAEGWADSKVYEAPWH